MKGFKSNNHANGHMTVGGLFNQRSYDRWKGGPNWRGTGERGRRGGREAWARGPGHRLSIFFKPGPLTGQQA